MKFEPKTLLIRCAGCGRQNRVLSSGADFARCSKCEGKLVKGRKKTGKIAGWIAAAVFVAGFFLFEALKG